MDSTKILLVEDNKMGQLVVRKFFSCCYVELSIAQNGEEALEMVAKEPYDLILMDILMPGIDGCQTAAILRERGFTMPIIALTADEDISLRKKARLHGIDEVLTKPFDAAALRRSILQLLPSLAC